MTERKGIVFKRNHHRRLMLIKRTDLNAYLDSLPCDDKGWYVFDWDTLAKTSNRGVFAKVVPLNPKDVK